MTAESPNVQPTMPMSNQGLMSSGPRVNHSPRARPPWNTIQLAMYARPFM